MIENFLNVLCQLEHVVYVIRSALGIGKQPLVQLGLDCHVTIFSYVAVRLFPASAKLVFHVLKSIQIFAIVRLLDIWPVDRLYTASHVIFYENIIKLS